MRAVGECVLELFRGAKSEVTIVAPFIRSAALERLVDVVGRDVKLTIVTRWLPADIVAGVSDLKILDVAREHNARLFLRNDLHAKLFISDQSCLVGSANVTHTALGWASVNNLELLVAVERANEEIQRFEANLLTHAVSASEEHRDRLAALAAELITRGSRPAALDDEVLAVGASRDWFPQTVNPEELFAVYQGDDADISRIALPVMRDELLQLGVPGGMREEDFRAWVGATVMQTPLIAKVMHVMDREGEVTEGALGTLLTAMGAELEGRSVGQILEALSRWLSFFLPSGYERVADSMKMIRVMRS